MSSKNACKPVLMKVFLFVMEIDGKTGEFWVESNNKTDAWRYMLSNWDPFQEQ